MKVKIAVIGATGSAYKRTLPALENSDICRAVAAQARNAELLEDYGGGGTLSDNGVHALDMAIALFGKPQKVAGNSAHIRFDTVFDSETAFLAYNGLSVTVSSSQSASPDFNDLVICGDCGRIEARGFFGEKSLRELTVDCGQEKRRTVYNDVNPYALEVEDFARRYVLNSTVEYCGSSLFDSVLAMQIIEEARK